jgi:hypothetical protein
MHTPFRSRITIIWAVRHLASAEVGEDATRRTAKARSDPLCAHAYQFPIDDVERQKPAEKLNLTVVFPCVWFLSARGSRPRPSTMGGRRRRPQPSLHAGPDLALGSIPDLDHGRAAAATAREASTQPAETSTLRTRPRSAPYCKPQRLCGVYCNFTALSLQRAFQCIGNFLPGKCRY